MMLSEAVKEKVAHVNGLLRQFYALADNKTLSEPEKTVIGDRLNKQIEHIEDLWGRVWPRIPKDKQVEIYKELEKIDGSWLVDGL